MRPSGSDLRSKCSGLILSKWRRCFGRRLNPRIGRHSPGVLVRHRHPLWRTAPDDRTYRKALAKFRDDQRLFLKRAHLWGYKGLSAQERKLAA